MITDSYLKMMSDIGMRSMHQSNNEELGFLLREKQRQQQQEMSDIYRSGSAPPTVDGSLSAVGGLLAGGGVGGGVSEERIRSDPAYISYYHANVNLNPRLPPPLVSKEDWRFAQRLQDGGSSAAVGDRRIKNGDDGVNGNGEWSGDGLFGLQRLELGSRQKSIAEMIQDNVTHPTSASKHPSRPISCNAFDDSVEPSDSLYAQLQQELSSMDALRAGSNIQGISTTQNVGSSASYTYASALGSSLSRSTTPEPQLVARTPTPRIPPISSHSFSGVSPGMRDPEDLVASLSGMTLSANSLVDQDNNAMSRIQQEIADQNYIKQHSYLNRSESEQLRLRSLSQSAKGSYGSGIGVDLKNPYLNNGGNSSSQYLGLDSPNSPFSNYGLSGHGINPASPSMLGNQFGSGDLSPLMLGNQLGGSGVDPRVLGGLALGPNLISAATELQNLSRIGNPNAGITPQAPLVNPLHLQYLRSNEYAAAQVAALSQQTMDRNSINNYMNLLELQKAYLGAALRSPQKSQYGISYNLGESASLSNGYYGNPALGLGMSYPGSPLGNALLPDSPFGPGSPIRHGDRSLRFPSGIRNFSGGVMGSLDGSLASSLLDEFKNNKAKCFELSEIAGHIVEFSADQYGSRFIQQKLETATTEEKNMVFQEIMPRALSLITDVFGNYVVQKFLELGTASQIRELADQLNGNVLALSLQMYGCRVIQKAIEVVELDQQTKMVRELDGHVARCVRDQNGNHVIQKCIECIPEEHIHFIVSTFYDQVVTLSTHPYGCRVIQRILEHCSDPKTQQIVMDEIMRSVCMLAQDQYGNYVVQHVLEHGKPHERTCIINKLIGQIVKMSQQKFASNVVEKCLTFGTPEERQGLVNEMLGLTDENEPLQAMMKDQFGNYVVQKVLETCDDQQLELILNRIKVHLNTLKKYTYGKHIVARVEKLVAAGEKRIGALASLSSAAMAAAAAAI